MCVCKMPATSIAAKNKEIFNAILSLRRHNVRIHNNNNNTQKKTEFRNEAETNGKVHGGIKLT